MTRRPSEPGSAPAPPVRCAVCGRLKPKGGHWLTATDPRYPSAPVVCGMRCARGWPAWPHCRRGGRKAR